MTKKALGKGLDALFSSEVSVNEYDENFSHDNIRYIQIDQIIPNPDQPRKTIDTDELNELAESIKEKGVLQPILLTPHNGNYMIIAGERRFLAAKKAQLTKIPAIIKSFSEEEMLEIAVIENIQRKDLNPIEEAIAISQIIEKGSYTHEDIAKRLGKSRVYVTNVTRLLRLPMSIKTKLLEGKLTRGHAMPLLQIDDEAIVQVIADKVINEGLSVRETEELVKKYAKGENTPKKEVKSKESQTDPFIKEIEEKLSYKFDTKVKINGSLEKGKIVIEYFNRDQLEKLLS